MSCESGYKGGKEERALSRMEKVLVRVRTRSQKHLPSIAFHSIAKTKQQWQLYSLR
jgi:hypothetical protein